MRKRLNVTNQKPPAHGSTLRKGRWSWVNHCYFITANAADRQPFFVERAVAEIIIESLVWLQENGRIRLMGFVVMPDHVHVALVLCNDCSRSRPEGRSHNSRNSLPQVMNSFKGYTGKRINEMLKRHGEVWQLAYHDHLVRDRRDFETRLSYMHGNPVRKGLVKYEHKYVWSTAHSRYAHLVDWTWLDGVEAGRARKGAPTIAI